MSDIGINIFIFLPILTSILIHLFSYYLLKIYCMPNILPQSSNIFNVAPLISN